VALVHDGAEMRRPEKLPTIVECPSALAHLRVCAQDMNTNCGRCEKCLRTMIPLRVLGVEGPFPPFRGLRAIRKMRIDNNIEKIFLAANVAFAQQSRDRPCKRLWGPACAATNAGNCSGKRTGCWGRISPADPPTKTSHAVGLALDQHNSGGYVTLS